MRRPSDSTEGIRTADPAVVSTSTRQMRHGKGGTGARSLTWAYLVALFVVYLLLLGWIVIWKLETPWVGEDRAIKLVPFLTTRQAGPSAPAEVLVNLVLFVPFGLYLGLLAPSQPWWRAAGTVVGASLALEITQYLLGVGRSDVTDVVVNLVGGLAGLGLLALAGGRLQRRTVGVMTLCCSIGTALVLLGAGLHLVSAAHLVHVKDAGPLAQTLGADHLTPTGVAVRGDR